MYRPLIEFLSNSSYRDMSSVPIEAGYIVERDVAKMTFAQKLHHMLSRDDLSDCINWNQHGRAFRIIVPRRLEERSLLSLYFGHNRYSTFLTQLQNYGFKQITRGKDRGSFYNEVWTNVASLMGLFNAFASREIKITDILPLLTVLSTRSSSFVSLHAGTQRRPQAYSYPHDRARP